MNTMKMLLPVLFAAMLLLGGAGCTEKEKVQSTAPQQQAAQTTAETKTTAGTQKTAESKTTGETVGKIAQAFAQSEGQDVAQMRDDQGGTALMFAAETGQTNIVNALIARGADVNAQNDRGYTALMLAVQKNHLDAAKALIAAGADVNAKDKDGKTALDVAKTDEIKELLKAAALK